MLVGDAGKILGNTLIPAAKFRGFQAPPKTIPRSPGHYIEWIAACKGGQAPGSNFNWAGPLAETVLLGNIALRSQLRDELTLKKLEWDSAALAFINLPEANRFVRREYRAGWTL